MIPVRIVNDAIDEEEEELISILQLEPVEGGLPNVQVDPDQTTLIIEDDDSELNTVVKSTSLLLTFLLLRCNDWFGSTRIHCQ